MVATDVKLSVLDLIPVRSDQSTSDALAASLELARLADELGYHRYWVAEHHNMPAVASTNPPVLIAMIAGATQRIRVGSGGVMLPNHAPLVVAEQFSLLEAAYPGRIDLGLGRAPGSDPVTSWALRHGAGGVESDAAARFDEHVSNLLLMLDPRGAELDLQGRSYRLNATPQAVGVPPVWLLGSSDFSARLAARLGLPYVFAHHFAGQGTDAALALYREGFTPSAPGAEPTTFLTVNVVVAETAEQAERLSIPQQLAMLRLRSGGRLEAQPLIEAAEAEKAELTTTQLETIAAMRTPWLIGDPGQVRDGLDALAERHGVDEIMVNPVAGELDGTPATASPSRQATLRLLSEVMAPVGV